MATLIELPVELLLAIANHLNKHQPILASLARVAQKFYPVAQEVLYESPTLPDPESNQSHVALLVRTLLNKPSLTLNI